MQEKIMEEMEAKAARKHRHRPSQKRMHTQASAAIEVQRSRKDLNPAQSKGAGSGHLPHEGRTDGLVEVGSGDLGARSPLVQLLIQSFSCLNMSTPIH